MLNTGCGPSGSEGAEAFKLVHIVDVRERTPVLISGVTAGEPVITYGETCGILSLARCGGLGLRSPTRSVYGQFPSEKVIVRLQSVH